MVPWSVLTNVIVNHRVRCHMFRMSDFLRKTFHSPVALVLYSSEIVSAHKLFLMVTIEVEKLPLLARDPPCTCPTLVTWIIARNVYGCHHLIPNWSRNSLVPNNVGCNSQNRDNMPRKSNMGFFCWVVYRVGGESSYRSIYDFHLAIWNVCALGQ